MSGRCGDLQRFGCRFPAYLEHCYANSEYDYLPDVARLEWACEEVRTSPDAGSLNLGGLAGIPQERYPELGFWLHPAHLVAEEISEQLSKRASFRRTMKRVIDQTMEAGAKGIKVQLSGRLGGSEMARQEKQIAGSIPLSTLRAKIDYGFVEAKTAQGHIGVQVWINQGMYEDDSDGADAQEGQAPKKPKRTYKR